MTPLAHRMVKELTLPLAHRTFQDSSGSNMLRRMSDIHCFDITEIQLAAYELSTNPSAYEGSDYTAFLPAPRTWLETANKHCRFGWLLEEKGGGIVRAQQATLQDIDRDVYFGTFGEPWELSLTRPYSSDPEKWTPDQLVPAYLLFINSPRVIGRRTHQPHRGLARALLAKRSVIGHFPLNAWTEIKLEVGPPRDESGLSSSEVHLTGQRALHFCRSHLRVRLGRLEIVRAHWRGDASLGIKQSRYKLIARSSPPEVPAPVS